MNQSILVQPNYCLMKSGTAMMFALISFHVMFWVNNFLDTLIHKDFERNRQNRLWKEKEQRRHKRRMEKMNNDPNRLSVQEITYRVNPANNLGITEKQIEGKLSLSYFGTILCLIISMLFSGCFGLILSCMHFLNFINANGKVEKAIQSDPETYQKICSLTPLIAIFMVGTQIFTLFEFKSEKKFNYFWGISFTLGLAFYLEQMLLITAIEDSLTLTIGDSLHLNTFVSTQRLGILTIGLLITLILSLINCFDKIRQREIFFRPLLWTSAIFTSLMLQIFVWFCESNGYKIFQPLKWDHLSFYIGHDSISHILQAIFNLMLGHSYLPEGVLPSLNPKQARSQLNQQFKLNVSSLRISVLGKESTYSESSRSYSENFGSIRRKWRGIRNTLSALAGMKNDKYSRTSSQCFAENKPFSHESQNDKKEESHDTLSVGNLSNIAINVSNQRIDQILKQK